MFWTFKQPKDTPVLADAELIDGSEEIFLIRRAHDGQWIFRHADHQAAGLENLQTTTLGKMARNYRFIKHFSHLEPGHQAWESDPDGGWDEAPLPTGDTFYLQFEATPMRGHPDFDEIAGAFVNCWIRSKSLEDAINEAQAGIRQFGWIVDDPDVAFEIKRENYEEENEHVIRFDQAQDDGSVFEYHCWPIDEEE